MSEAADYAFDHSIPLFTTLELAQYCNFSCRHCYNFDRTDSEKVATRTSEISTKRWLEIIDEVIDEGAFYVSFTGGEPLTHPDLFTFVDRVRQRHCIAKVKTNASLISESMAKKLFEHGVYSLDVSLYGANEQSYKDFCGVELFEKTVQGIKNATKLGITVTINILLHKGNYQELGELIKLAESLECFYNLTDEITERYDGTGGEGLWKLGESELREIFEGQYKEYFMYDNKDGNVQCSCARTVCAVSSLGEVYPCIGAPVASGNIKENLFSDIWNNSNELNKIRGLKESDFSSCTGCSLRSNCSRSSGTVYVNTGNYTGCEDHTKMTARLRQEYNSVKK